MIVAGLSCIRILEAVKKSLQTFPSASVPLGDVGANFGFEQVSVSKMSEALTGPSNIFFHLRKRWVNGGHVSQWHSAGDGVSTYGIVFDASMGPENQGSRVLVHSQLLDARCSKCSKLVLDVPRHRWY
jgi:hypothetical protein